MSLYIRDGIVLPSHLKIELLTGIFSAIAYGIVLVLSGKFLSSTPDKTGHLSQSHADSSPHLCYSHAAKQHLEANRIDLSTYGCSYPNPRQYLLVSFIWNGSRHDHVGSRWVHGEDSNSSPGIKIYNTIADMALSRLVSGRLQRFQDWNNCPPFTYFIGIFW
jgi:hypothetical protein